MLTVLPAPHDFSCPVDRLLKHYMVLGRPGTHYQFTLFSRKNGLAMRREPLRVADRRSLEAAMERAGQHVTLFLNQMHNNDRYGWLHPWPRSIFVEDLWRNQLWALVMKTRMPDSWVQSNLATFREILQPSAVAKAPGIVPKAALEVGYDDQYGEEFERWK